MDNAQKRTDREWIEVLTGQAGPEEQQLALLELANYLFVVAWSILQKRRGLMVKLQSMSDDDLAALAEEFVQCYMAKMIKDNFALLDKYGGHGSFPSWAAQVISNLCRSELRRCHWNRNERLETSLHQRRSAEAPPDRAAYQSLIRMAILRCLEMLPEHYRYALVGRVVEERTAVELGEVLNISANAVHILVYRAKRMMRGLLEQEGVGAEALAFWGD